MNRARILYEDNDMIVCHKPAGIATQTARVGQADMVSEICNYLVAEGAVPYAGVVHRLDQPVEGIVIFAKNKRSAAALSRQFQENRVEKYYCAVVCGQTFAPAAVLTDHLLKDGQTNCSRIVPPDVPNAQKAVLDYTIKAQMPYGGEEGSPWLIALAGIRLHTGRHHQIRAQMSHAGMCLLGDRKYAGEEALRISERMHVKDVALCACRLSLFHPVTGAQLSFETEPENEIFHLEYWKDYADPASHRVR